MPLSNCYSDIIQAIKALLHRDSVFLYFDISLYRTRSSRREADHVIVTGVG